jgi:hypothetical protein
MSARAKFIDHNSDTADTIDYDTVENAVNAAIEYVGEEGLEELRQHPTKPVFVNERTNREVQIIVSAP